jgi:DNA-directed RNA polymerase subunit M/transcription elongation factor TFIIS
MDELIECPECGEKYDMYHSYENKTQDTFITFECECGRKIKFLHKKRNIGGLWFVFNEIVN